MNRFDELGELRRKFKVGVDCRLSIQISPEGRRIRIPSARELQVQLVELSSTLTSEQLDVLAESHFGEKLVLQRLTTDLNRRKLGAKFADVTRSIVGQRRSGSDSQVHFVHSTGAISSIQQWSVIGEGTSSHLSYLACRYRCKLQAATQTHPTSGSSSDVADDISKRVLAYAGNRSLAGEGVADDSRRSHVNRRRRNE